MSTFEYPVARKSDQIDLLHGVEIADPYRWLEDGNSAETRAWIETENKLTHLYLDSIPERAGIQKRLTELWDYPRYGIPFRKGGRTFYFHNSGLQNQAVLFVRDKSAAPERVLLDPNLLSDNGTVALSSLSISEDGNLMAYAISRAGSDWLEWSVLDIATCKNMTDCLHWSKFSGAAWTNDSLGFFYGRYAEPVEGSEFQSANFNHQIYYHRLGDNQSKDTLIYERPDQPEWFLFSSVTDDGKYLVISAGRGTDPEKRVYVKDLVDPLLPKIEPSKTPIRDLLVAGDAKYAFIDNDGENFWFWTNNDAPLGKVIEVNIENPAPSGWKSVIPECADTLEDVNRVGDRFFMNYLSDAKSIVRMSSLTGEPIGEVALPGIGSAGGFGGDKTYVDTYYSFTSFTSPGAIYKFDLATGNSELFFKPELKFDPDLYETHQVFTTSRDGTKIPMFLSHLKSLKKSPTNRVFLYAYGGFQISVTPSFSVGALAWMEMGGIYAVANLRGGGEYGKSWHDKGIKLKKQNVFDDFIGAAEWLIAKGYSSLGKIAIAGGSNGGLLVGACMTQRPELFGAALPDVGVMDMLRFHKFTIGWGWKSDYGSPDNEDEFKALLAYSPLHNIKRGTHYPPTLVSTSDHDDRVVPAHSFKFAAALQAAQVGDAPTLIRIQTDAGHGAGKPTSKLIEEAADRWAFVVKSLG